MRQNNQNKRMRGRSRKGPNPLSRSYESNGPDVKIRGTALHVAEKYVQLARDAQSSGDRVIGENYLQHAEHYFRIVAAAQGQAPQQGQTQPQGANQRDEAREGDAAVAPAAPAAPEQSGDAVMPADAPQPFVDAMPGINSKTSNGSGRPPEAGADAPAEDGNGAEPASAAGGDGPQEEDSKPRRRVRGTRGRGSRRPASEATEAEAPAKDPVEATTAETSAEDATANSAAESPEAGDVADADAKPVTVTDV